jgi:hypothetical protein
MIYLLADLICRTGNATSELEKKIQQDSNSIKFDFIRRLKFLTNKSKEDEKDIKKEAPTKLETREQNTEKDVPVKLKRSNTIFGQIVKFIQNLPDW